MIVLGRYFKTTLLNKNIAIDKKIEKIIEQLKNRNFRELKSIDISNLDLKSVDNSKLKTIINILEREKLTNKEDAYLSKLKEKVKNALKERVSTKESAKKEIKEKAIPKSVNKTALNNIKDKIAKIKVELFKSAPFKGDKSESNFSKVSKNLKNFFSNKEINKKATIDQQKIFENANSNKTKSNRVNHTRNSDLTNNNSIKIKGSRVNHAHNTDLTNNNPIKIKGDKANNTDDANLANNSSNKIKPGIELEKIEKIFKDIETSFKKLEKNLNDSLNTQKEPIKEIINSLKEMTKELKTRTDVFKNNQIDKIVKEIDETIEALKELSTKTINKLSSSIEKELDKILYKAIKGSQKAELKLFSSSKINAQLDNLVEQIKDIEHFIEAKPDFKKYLPILKKYTASIENIDLKNNINNSGVFFESKLKEIALQKESNLSNIENDLKNILQHIDKDAKRLGDKTLWHHTQKAISHIETLQLNSIINSNINIFIPFNWDDLESGTLNFSKQRDGSFSCKIDLNLKKFGKIDIFMLLTGNDISIGIDVKDKSFKEILLENKTLLNRMLKSIRLNPYIFFHSKKSDIYGEEDDIKLGMDMKI